MNLRNYGNFITIDLEKLVYNYNIIKLKFKRDIVGVVKSNCYGFGVKHIAPVLYDLGCRKFAVSVENDGVYIRKLLGNNVEIIILNGYNCDLSNIYNEFKLLPAICTLEQLSLIDKKTNCWVHFDTGLNRNGITYKEWDLAYKLIKEKKVNVIMSHLTHTTIDMINNEQLSMSKDLFVKYNNYDISFIKTSGLFLDNMYFYNNGRIGHGLYFKYDFLGTKNIAYWQAKIIQLKYTKKHEKIGYNGSFIVHKDMHIATVSCGYFNGIKTNHPYVIVNKKRCAIVGTISMEMITIDVTSIEDVDYNTPVFIFYDNWGDIANKLSVSCGNLSSTINAFKRYC